jgi:hypothetical protein
MTEKKTKDPKEEIIKTCAIVWKHASENKTTWIQKLLSTLLKQAKILKWESTEKPHEYQLELAHELLGNHPEIPIGQIVLKQKMKIAFSEEKISGSDKYRQKIAFPDQGACLRIGIGWLSKESALHQIVIEEDQSNEIWCIIEGMGQKLVKPADFTLNFWNKAEWT